MTDPDPFSTSTLMILDSIRVLLVLVSIVVAGWSVSIGRLLLDTRQFGCYSLSCYALFAAMFEFTRLGEERFSLGLLFILAGTGFGLMYCYRVTKQTHLRGIQ